ncbi:MAG: gliding motility-associated ABC transporter substrate-binding protein GldG [Bacteroidales bacterium]|nr:gliding motility-associated ABC transporter substrate-binding protein GldG [Bacteroidales bacterium]MBO7229028.1 gliding motility-associated ABC transporter substrate-binding protein GldG [Bacteroidales bacterium]MBQ1191243.1 gliding motility-associated ABC transporter substrate-binding protein GldG [Bacteroidales bacterium]MBQ2303831.1 gliding motility-associated ABC transporter substrate-binding protein GldG [Bacteroidales bacterium]MEE0910289.1 gliding motility-associated ABC transporter 
MKKSISKFFKTIFKPTSVKADVKRSHLLQLLLGLVTIIFINILGYYFFVRIDLTEEKRYSLSVSTKKLLKEIDEVVFVRCYLDGDMPAEYKALKNETKEMLDQFRAYNPNIEYEFVDPNGFENRTERDEFYRRLFERGLSPINIKTTKSNTQVQQYIFPYIDIVHKGRTYIAPLLSSKKGVAGEGIIAGSIENLEYNIYSSIRSIVNAKKDKVVFLYGHGELPVENIYDFVSSLSEYYEVDSITINEKLNSLTDRIYDTVDLSKVTIENKYKCMIVAKPTSIFSYKDLYIIDQYIMHGGKVLWLLDALNVSMDSLQAQSSTVAISNFTGVDDILFRYGAKVNTNLIMDLQCAKVPIVTGQYQDNMPQMSYYPWNFFPEIHPNSNHIISDKISPVKMEFVSSIDTTASQAEKTVLLYSSNGTRIMNAPVNVSLNMLKQKQDAKLFNAGSKPVAMLLEGEFVSAFKNRLTATMEENTQIAFKDFSDTTAMIVVADGDICKNDFINGQLLPLGYDKYTRQMYGNKEFLVNCVNYLCGDVDLIPLRSREVIMRKLDTAKIERERTFWQVINVVVPVVIILVVGLVLTIFRKRKYSRKFQIKNTK